MTKYNQQSPYAHNNKEFNKNNNAPRKQDHGVFINVSQADKEKAVSAVQHVQDAFKSLGYETKVVDYTTKVFNQDKQRKERHRAQWVRPIDAQGKPVHLGVYGTETAWAEKSKQWEILGDANTIVKHIATQQGFRNLVEAQ